MKEKGKVKKYKEKHKTDEPGVGEIALNYKRQVRQLYNFFIFIH